MTEEICEGCGEDHSDEATLQRHVQVGTLSETSVDGESAYELSLGGLGLLEELLSFAAAELSPYDDMSLEHIKQLTVISSTLWSAREFVLDYIASRVERLENAPIINV